MSVGQASDSGRDGWSRGHASERKGGVGVGGEEEEEEANAEGCATTQLGERRGFVCEMGL